MSPSEIFLQYSAALNRGDFKGMTLLIHNDFRLEGAGLNGIGKIEFLAAMKAQMDAFPDYSENPTDIREDGDVVHFTAHVRGTHKGILALPGMNAVPITGRSIQLPPEPAWVQVNQGKILVYHVDPVPGGGINGILSQLENL